MFKTRALLAAVVATACALAGRAADGQEVERVLEKYRSVRPQAKDLAVYGLKWVPTRQAARERAGMEQRPVLLLVVTNSFGNLYTGHC